MRVHPVGEGSTDVKTGSRRTAVGAFQEDPLQTVSAIMNSGNVCPRAAKAAHLREKLTRPNRQGGRGKANCLGRGPHPPWAIPQKCQKAMSRFVFNKRR